MSEQLGVAIAANVESTERETGWTYSGRTLLLAGVCFASSAVGLVALRAMSYSTSFVVRGSVEEVLKPPAPSFGSLASAPELALFRAKFNAHCVGLRGIAAAICVSNVFAREFPHADPSIEFVDAAYVPAEALRRHSAGGPGHCTTRSALGAAMLLSAGVPVRVVQLLPRDSSGHNMLEVWDEADGWVLIDPSFGAILRTPAKSGASAVSALDASNVLSWKVEGERPQGVSGREVIPRSLFIGGGLVFPEPWLYLRTGNRQAPWPFRGYFVHVGSNWLEDGGIQWGLRALTVMAGLVGVVLTLLAFRRRLDHSLPIE